MDELRRQMENLQKELKEAIEILHKELKVAHLDIHLENVCFSIEYEG